MHWISTQPAPDEITTLLCDLEVGSGKTNRLVLITAHRRENFGQPLEQICTAINNLADEYAGKVKFVYPVHLNPNVQQPVYRMLRQNSNITLLPPLDYLPLVHLMRQFNTGSNRFGPESRKKHPDLEFQLWYCVM